MGVKFCQMPFVHIFKRSHTFSGFTSNLFEFLALEMFLNVLSLLDSEDSSLNKKGPEHSGNF